jgi:cyclopropane-fatty-acyl-phospholipid synthase
VQYALSGIDGRGNFVSGQIQLCWSFRYQWYSGTESAYVERSGIGFFMLTEKKHGFLDLQPRRAQPHRTTRSATALERWLVQQLLRLMGNPPICFSLWDNEMITSKTVAAPVAVIRLADPATLWRLLKNPGLNFGDDYSAGLIEIDGDLVQFIETAYLHSPASNSRSVWERYVINRPQWTRRNNLRDSKRNIHHHYDLGNEFYRLWLDKDMLYTCAYFPEPDVTLEQAQQAKLEHICKKLRLRAGDTVVEAGCGWGSLALYMARQYGVTVHAYNISHEQIIYARARAKAEGLDKLVTFCEDDYRNIQGKYAVFVSVGMLEHVGRRNFATLGKVIDRSLHRHGRGLLHSIAQNEPALVNEWIARRIFPGGYPPTLREMTGILEPVQCVVTDVENLRAHYARTLEHWLARFNSHEGQIREMYDATFVRAWRLYLSASIANFTTNSLQLYQVSFTRTTLTDTPWTRAHLYH